MHDKMGELTSKAELFSRNPATTSQEASTLETVLSRSLPTRPGDIIRSDGHRRGLNHRESETSAQSLPPALSANVNVRPPLNRGQSQIQMALNGSANFVGWNDTEGDIRRNWGSKRLRFLAKKYNLNHRRVLNEARSLEAAAHYDLVDHPGQSTPATEWSVSQAHATGRTDPVATPASMARSLSQASESCIRTRSERRESAARLAYGSIANIAKRGVICSQRMHRVRLSSRQSFDMDLSESGRASSPGTVEGQRVAERLPYGADFEVDLPRRTGSPIVEESPTDVSVEGALSFSASSQEAVAQNTPSKEEECEMYSMDTSSFVTAPEEIPLVAPEKPHAVRSVRPKLSTQENIDIDDLFFAFSPGDKRTRRRETSVVQVKDPHLVTIKSIPKFQLSIDDKEAFDNYPHIGGISRWDLGDGRLHLPIGRVALGPQRESDHYEVTQPDRPLIDGVKSIAHTISRYPLVKQASVIETTKRGIVDGVLRNLGHHGARIFRPRYRRYRGLGVLSSFYDGSLHREKIDSLDPMVREVIEAGSDERPLFTWWITIVQVIVCIVSLMFYGLGPTGWERVEMKDEVIDVTLAMRQVSYYEPVNLWIGPRFADLIRLGAKYSPCMRQEPGLWKLIGEERMKENATGCCVFNDGTGCYQTGQSSCPRSLATWHKWPKQKPTLRKSVSDSFLPDDINDATLSREVGASHQGLPRRAWRTAGAVCGQDPDFCVRPPSVIPYEWPDDLTKWPVCEQQRYGAFLPQHMTCQITGRPCCIQMQGQCRIATREYCAFVKGHFHENATLCSQVNCFSDVCGMLPFLRRDYPDQFYRLLFSLFLHAGVLHVIFTVFVQMWLMLDLEMLIGWKRMAILYIGSGIGGNLASSIFVPYSPEVGPSGSHLGIMAALVIDLHHHRHIIVRPQRELGKHMMTVLILFLTGLLPWVDNWAHLFGFVFGLLITIVTFPYLNFESQEKPRHGCRSSLSRRHFAIITALLSCIFLYLLLGYIYFDNVRVICPWCQYFNCINIIFLTGSHHFCDNTGHKLSQWLPI